jgi:hypothetical protein
VKKVLLLRSNKLKKMSEELVKDISNIALRIQTFGQFVKLTKGQSALIREMRDCVKNKKSISWDILVDLFYNNVSTTQSGYKYVGIYPNNHREDFYYDIKEEYALQSFTWQYYIRSRVRQWFVSSIGILVLKNQLVVIPTIEIDE